MRAKRNLRILRAIPVSVAVCLVCFPLWATDMGEGTAKLGAQASRYVFVSDQSTVVQTGGIAGVHWTYSIKGQFQLGVDRAAGTASFTHVDANATDDGPFKRTLDPNHVFNMTSLVGTVIDDTTISFTGKADNGSNVRITATMQDGSVHLVGQTTPPANSADFFLFSMDAVAQRKYGGGGGTAQDPYQIATAADLITLGNEPNDCNKHFILTADIDLDPNLPGRKVFDNAVIGSFGGVFDGNGHTISHLTITGKSYGYVGLFGQLLSGAEVRDLGAVDLNVAGLGDTCTVGGLVGDNGGNVTQCYVTGVVSSNGSGCAPYGVGGLVGTNGGGSVTHCHSTAAVSSSAGFAGAGVGGLVGYNDNSGWIATSYSSGSVSGTDGVGGLVGWNDGWIATSYSTATVSGTATVGGLVGNNGNAEDLWSHGSIADCYASGSVSGKDGVGGLVGCNQLSIATSYSSGSVTGSGQNVGGLVGGGGDYGGTVTASFWDMQTSGEATSAGGTGKTTAEMHDPNAFRAAGWSFAPHDIWFDIWFEPEGGGYPVLWWQLSPLPSLPRFSGGTGEANDPYRISTAQDLNSIGYNPRLMKCHFKLVADLDLTGLPFYPIGAERDPYAGVFDGNGHTISHLTIRGESYVGLFAWLGSGAEVKDLGVVDVNITGSGYNDVGALAGSSAGTVIQCYSTGVVRGTGWVGGLVGTNRGTVTQCYSTGTVSGVGSGGGLVGANGGTVTQCYSTGAVSGTGQYTGGLVGWSGDAKKVTASFWDTQTSGQKVSAGGIGKTTAEMQTAKMFIDAGWDFVGETGNGTDDIWKIVEGQTYPLLSWQKYSGGTGEPNDPYEIATAADLIALGETPEDYDKHFILTADIDLDPNLLGGRVFDTAVIGTFAGVLDGNGHTISHLRITGWGGVGLFGQLAPGAEVRNLGVVDVNIAGMFSLIGAIAGENRGTVTHCYGTGTLSGFSVIGGLVGHVEGGLLSDCRAACSVTGGSYIGGLVGSLFHGSATRCHSTGTVDGAGSAGGLVGENLGGVVAQCYSSGSVSGSRDVGGLVGQNYGDGRVSNSYSTARVTGNKDVGGLVGWNESNIFAKGHVIDSYSAGVVTGSSSVGGLVGYNTADVGGSKGEVTASFWDTQSSGRTTSSGGTGKTTTEMQTAKTFLEAGWDFVGETANGTEDIWWILEGKDYPHLWWEAAAK